MTISDTVYNLCHAEETVSSELARDPSAAPADIYKKLYSKYDHEVNKKKFQSEIKEITEDDLKRAEECGRWGPTKPSELFLQVILKHSRRLRGPDTNNYPSCSTMHSLRLIKALLVQLSVRHSSAAAV
jgi:hypothetical protein